jgi:hypothetical protein
MKPKVILALVLSFMLLLILTQNYFSFGLLISIENGNPPKTHSTPELQLGFIHMRKSGGTHINRIVTEFMIEHGCINATEKVSVRGIKNGIPIDMLDNRFRANYTADTVARCPNVNMVHEEFLSLDGKSYEDFPRRGERGDQSFTLLTTLRDPIERIGSQSFYGKYSVARTVLMEVINASSNPNCDYYKSIFREKNPSFNPLSESELCSKSSQVLNNGMRFTACVCFQDSMNTTKDIIRTNETVWFRWINNVVGYQDQYLSNYFIRRLVSRTSVLKGRDELNTLSSKKSTRCIIQNNCQSTIRFNILQDVLLFEPGVGYDEVQASTFDKYDIKQALQISKYLLKYQFDFIIMEYFDQPRTTNAIKSALHNSLAPPKNFIGNNDNSGIFSFSNVNNTKNPGHGFRRLNELNYSRKRRLTFSRYKDTMPPSVLEFLEKDNAEDIELYKFALEEFEVRSRLENWG